MWDIGGEEALRSSWNTYYSSAEYSEQGDTFIEEKAHHSQLAFAGQFIILVIDSMDRDQLLTALLYEMLPS
ncbi:hypothetical protein E2I00_013880 [Balaenoptera physalus]|uniref:Uncharacterized protein n=1 Tax=Balaenoptera physalus TaxID=9770 RepID=A0A643CEJ1_BALPH|nr:hypothetical protein E2I00_013880 [Balaenoptera physalus]